ncbi:MAG: FAD-binding protein, partial [Alphaproteobacteria bacterium]|nr:FAD-binding protein [Alphaproteobacteria bacterium]
MKRPTTKAAAKAAAKAGANAERELGEQIEAAAAHGQRLRIAGGRTKLALGDRVRATGQISTIALTGIVDYAPGSLSIVVRAGTQWSHLEEVLGAEGQRLAFDPPDYRGIFNRLGEPTIGGIVACGLSGPGRVRYGACRDALLGVRFINGRGEVIRSGGKVMKNVTGYDLVKLMCGSFGTLGVLTEVSFKTAPIPRHEKTLVIKGLDDAGGIAVLRQALGTPFEVTGAAHLSG